MQLDQTLLVVQEIRQPVEVADAYRAREPNVRPDDFDLQFALAGDSV